MIGINAAAPLAPVVGAAARVLAGTFGGTVRLRAEARLTEPGRGSLVLRCRVLAAPAGVPPYVVVKCVRGDRAYDSADRRSWRPLWRLLNEWAGGQFLAACGEDSVYSPRVYGGDRALGFVVLEDLGTGERLVDLLLGRDPVRAEAGLIGLAAALGRLHAATVGREAEYEHLRAALGTSVPATQRAQRRRLDGLAGAVRQFRRGCEMAGCRPAPGFDQEWAAVTAAMVAPGPFLAYTHGDPVAHNVLCSGSAVRLFDFETGRYRHALLDGVCAVIPFPHCWCVGRLPAHLPPRLLAAYRAALATGCAAAHDDGQFGRAVAEAWAWWLIATTGSHLARALAEDWEYGLAPMRQRLLVGLDTFADLACQTGQLEAMGATAGALAARLRARWPATPAALPLFPAFR